MLYAPLGSSNLRVSRLCLGTMMFGGKTDDHESIRITRAALDAGVNFVDTADIYTDGACETILGKALQGQRDRAVLATKGGMRVGGGPNDEGISRWHLVRAVEASLRRLNTDRIDLYYIHWPMAHMNLDETLRTLDDLVRQGKILYAACSNFPAWLVCRSNWLADLRRYVPLVCGQYPYNLIERGLEVEILPMAHALGFGITVYRPLAVGVLTGKYLTDSAEHPVSLPAGTRGADDQRIARWTARYADGLRKARAFATQNGCALADLANAWVLATPGVTSVIVGVSRLEQLQANLKGLEWQLTPEQRAEVAALLPTDVQEEAGGKFPSWRRSYDIAAHNC